MRAKDNFEKLLDDLQNHNLPISKLIKKYPKMKWCILNNSVYDLTNFDHPGGKYIIEQIIGKEWNLNYKYNDYIGKEIGRYFYGAYALESSDSQPYNHSNSAKQILYKRLVGELQIESNNIFQIMYKIKFCSS